MDNRKYIKYQDIKFYWHPKYKYYLASKNGKILSIKWNKKRILKLHTLRNGYLYFGLHINNTQKNYLVHRFVYETFKGKIPSDKQTDHIDNNKENNSLSNLQLLSPSENTKKSHFKKKVISFNLENKEEITFDSLKEAAEFYQIHKSTVSAICRKIRKTSKSKRDGQRCKFFYL